MATYEHFPIKTLSLSSIRLSEHSDSDHKGDCGHSFSRRYVKRIFRRKHVKIHCIIIYLHISFVLKNYVFFSPLHLSIFYCTCTAHNAHALPIKPNHPTLDIYFLLMSEVNINVSCAGITDYWLDTLLLTSLLCPQIENIIGKCLSTPIIEPLAQKLINKLCIVIILSRDG